jgi:hypothetical protein
VRAALRWACGARGSPASWRVVRGVVRERCGSVARGWPGQPSCRASTDLAKICRLASAQHALAPSRDVSARQARETLQPKRSDSGAFLKGFRAGTRRRLVKSKCTAAGTHSAAGAALLCRRTTACPASRDAALGPLHSRTARKLRGKAALLETLQLREGGRATAPDRACAVRILALDLVKLERCPAGSAGVLRKKLLPESKGRRLVDGA